MNQTDAKILDQIKKALSRAPLDGWQVTETQKTSHQSFLALNDRECERTVNARVFSIMIMKEREGNKGKVLGLSRFKIAPNQIGNLDSEIEKAIFRASLVSNQPFSLPERASSLPQVALADPDAQASALPELEDRARKTAEKEKGIRLSTTEFFIDRVLTRLINHKGLDVTQEETLVEMELILLAENDGKEKEYITRYTRRFLRDFNLEDELSTGARMAREATEARLPQTGTFPVLFSEEPLDGLFDAVVARASGSMKYNKIVQSEPGQNALDAEGPGTKINLWSNPVIPRMVGSHAFDQYGTPGKKILLIQDGKVRQFLADKRISDYLKVPLTGEIGNVEIEPGEDAFNDLMEKGKSRTPFYHITAFSAFEPNDVTGAFSAEIRAGTEYGPNGARPIKGGSVSGVLLRDLANALFSKETVQRETIRAPKGVFFPHLSLAGE